MNYIHTAEPYFIMIIKMQRNANLENFTFKCFQQKLIFVYANTFLKKSMSALTFFKQQKYEYMFINVYKSTLFKNISVRYQFHR